MNKTLTNKLATQWSGIELAMNYANSNPALRSHVEWVVDRYFEYIDEIAAALESRSMSGNGKIWTI